MGSSSLMNAYSKRSWNSPWTWGRNGSCCWTKRMAIEGGIVWWLLFRAKELVILSRCFMLWWTKTICCDGPKLSVVMCYLYGSCDKLRLLLSCFCLYNGWCYITVVIIFLLFSHDIRTVFNYFHNSFAILILLSQYIFINITSYT